MQFPRRCFSLRVFYLLSIPISFFSISLLTQLPVTSCRDGYYDTAGVSRLTPPIGMQLCCQVAPSYFEQGAVCEVKQGAKLETLKKKRWRECVCRAAGRSLVSPMNPSRSCFPDFLFFFFPLWLCVT